MSTLLFENKHSPTLFIIGIDTSIFGSSDATRDSEISPQNSGDATLPENRGISF